MQYISLFFITVLFFGGCTIKEDISYERFDFSNANLKKVSWDEIENLHNSDFNGSYEAFLKACSKSIRFETLTNSCIAATNSLDSKEFFFNNFTPYKLYNSNHTDKGLLTGYYESTLYGSHTKTQRYKYPIYAIPDDIYTIDLSSIYPELSQYRLRGRIEGNKIVPYYSRDEIEKFDDTKYEVLAYVDDDIELFFLHIQGSGKIIFEDGSVVNVGYGMQNGHKYYAIGRELIAMGELTSDTVSLQSIAKWLNENPDKKNQVMNLNQSYIFFTKNNQGATGSLGTELVAQKNIAVDRSFVPLGFPVFINTSHPITKENINDILIATDTGGAIKGEIRGDFFWGFGKDAKEVAGVMKEPFTMYMLVPNELIR